MLLKTRPVRYIFIAIVLLAVLLTVYNFYFIYPNFKKIIIQNTEDEAVMLGTYLGDMFFLDDEYLSGNDIVQMKRRIDTLAHDFNLLKMKVLSPSGEIFYSTSMEDIGKANDYDYFHDIVAKGNSYTKTVKKDMWSLEGQKVQADVVETYVPVMSGDYFIGAFEMHYDISSQVTSFGSVMNQSMIIALLILICGIVITTVMMVKLDKSIVRQEEVEEELKVFAGKLHQSNRELESFAHITSHDLQEPLRKITVFGDRLKLKYGDALDNQGLDYHERMQNAAKRMQNLINGLLTYSRVSTKAKPFAPVNLSSVAQEVLADLEIRLQETGGQVEIEEMPTVKGDPLQMRQLLQNLIGNALKFHKKEETPVVRVSGTLLNKNGDAHGDKEPTGEFCQIICRDNGIGFDKQYEDRIFGVFQRLHGKSEYEGSGVGLSVCKKIVERHGGTIKAEGTPGEGAAFIINLPVDPSAAQDMA
jgi:signal transduction histidine kinase